MPLFLVHHAKRAVLVTAPTLERARELAPAIAISFEFVRSPTRSAADLAEASGHIHPEASRPAGLGPCVE
jgi:hypothetical protein